MKTPAKALLSCCLVLGSGIGLWYGPLTSRESRRIGEAVRELDRRLGSDETLRLSLKILEVEGLPKELADRSFELALRLPDRLRLETEIDGHAYRLGRDGETIWFDVPHRQLAIEGRNDIPRFSGLPDSVAPVALPELKHSISSWQLAFLPALVRVERTDSSENRSRCRPSFLLARLAKLPED